jgi:hypothetical protein
MADDLGHQRVDCLHLLAALLKVESSSLVQVLNSAGLNRLRIIASLQQR